MPYANSGNLFRTLSYDKPGAAHPDDGYDEARGGRHYRNVEVLMHPHGH